MSDPLEKVAAASRDVDREIFRRTVKPCVTPEVIAEHRGNPFGPGHSPELEVVLRYLRRDPVRSKPRYVLVAAQPEKEYRIALSTRERGVPLTVTDESFASSDAAQHAIFVKRLRDLDDADIDRAVDAAER